jgi:hypothetical protein
VSELDVDDGVEEHDAGAGYRCAILGDAGLRPVVLAEESAVDG